MFYVSPNNELTVSVGDSTMNIAMLLQLCAVTKAALTNNALESFDI